MNVPDNLKYTNDHEWVKIDNDIAIVGITDFAQSELGDIVYVEIDTKGDLIEKDSVFGTVEAVKTVSDLFMPLTGEILEVNSAIEETPEIINNEPYESGWIIKIKIEDINQIRDLLDSSGYLEVIGG
ncbi:MAG: glycine cleavage system protein H [Flavobacteriaceae bacterium]|nr:glycine cleavage system protein H [Flavobacteriaceae bacterium]OUW37249.1 MAG: glycine cleavage system protein H [Flavobacteriaceae bacterium TMED184]|tara:strand:- start:1740 stop:2120 length:381 start_codon:yes stop_codon:yes gene_type:complete